jgi:ParB family transcriptional regulator, chromosome partitioning protein
VTDIAPVLQRIRLSDVKVDQRLRPVSHAGVQAILASVADIGRIKDPVHVRRSKKGLTLLAGGHRMAAYAELGIEEADAWVWSGITDDHARLIEIDDNLAGAEMTALDTAVFLAERKRVYEKLHPETRAKTGAALAAARWDAADIVSVASFVATTAEKFGMSDRHVRRLVAAGEKLGVDSARLRHCPRPITLKDLSDIAGIKEPVERYAVIDALREGTARSASVALAAHRARERGDVTVEKDPVEDGFNALMKAWSRAPMAAKKRFLLEMRTEVWEAQNKGAALTNWAEAAA